MDDGPLAVKASKASQGVSVSAIQKGLTGMLFPPIVTAPAGIETIWTLTTEPGSVST